MSDISAPVDDLFRGLKSLEDLGVHNYGFVCKTSYGLKRFENVFDGSVLFAERQDGVGLHKGYNVVLYIRRL